MQFEPQKIHDVVLIKPRQFGDDRGYFMETFRSDKFAEATGFDGQFVQDNQSFSAHANTVRGLHYQSPPHAQAKLVRCPRGGIIDVAVDMRPHSSTYGQWVSALLSAENAQQLFVPAGFLHGFSTLMPNTEVHYKCTDYYAADCDGSVAWNDPDLNVDWGVQYGFDTTQAVLSEKDAMAPTLKKWDNPF